MLGTATKFINGDLSEQMLVSEMECKHMGFVNMFFFCGLVPGYERGTQFISGDLSEQMLISEMKYCCFMNIRM